MASTQIRFVSFDCYGTLMDWDTGINKLFKKVLPTKNKKYLDNAIHQWEVIQFKLIQEKYLPYQNLQRESFVQLFSKLGIPIKYKFNGKIMSTISSLDPFPDVYQSLLKLSSYKLILISNGPLSALKRNIQKMRVKFEIIISAEKIRVYKPSLDVFRYALKQLNCSPSEIIHIAAGYKYDVIPAKKLGIKVVWLNRENIPNPGKISPDYEIPNLTSLPGIIGLI